jgi:WD40 repeat protein/serine/threonine protein kinase
MSDGPIADLAGRKLGDFVLREQIGEGGCAVVYRCEQPQLRRSAVVKVLHERGQRSDAALDRFRREAQLASQLDHPYAAHVYAFGDEDDGLFWIAMELVQGIALDDWLEAHGPMPLAQFVPFFECVADVVHAAHERGIVHRDLKPSNVMVIDRNGRLFPKLLDFGIAKLTGEPALPVPEHPAGAEAVTTAPLGALRRRAQRTRTDPAAKDHRLTRTSAKLGSTAYMSPEQWTHPQAVGAASDIYSLGVLAYEVLTGRKPFTADSTHEYYHQHVYAEVPPLGDAFPPEVGRVIRRALAKAPEARHGNALELAAELRAALQLQPHEQLRSLAQVWDARARSPELLVQSKDLLRAPTAVVGELERAFVTESRRHAVRRARLRRVFAATAMALALGAIWYRGKLQTELAEQQVRAARQLTEATMTQSELEQGRAALLHDEPDALPHLAEAYRRDPAPSTAFMLARAMQPRLAEQARFQSSFGRMWSATFSPDGTQIVTTDDRNAQIWDAQTHRLRFTLPHADTVYHAVYSTDGTRLATAGGDGRVKLWDARDGTLVHELRRDPKLRYVAAAIASDGKLVAAIDVEGAVAHVWDADTGVLLAELANSAAEFSSIAFDATGHWLATSGGNDVRVFDTRTWARILTIPGPGIDTLSWDPSSPRLLTGSLEGEVSLWRVPGGQRIHRLREAGRPVDAVAFSPDGGLVVAASRDGTEHIWDARTGKLRVEGNYLHEKISSVEFDRTSMLLVTATRGGVAVVDIAQGMPVSVLERSRNVFTAVHFDSGSHRLVGASWDGAARLWDAGSPYLRWRTPTVSNDCGVVTSLEPDRRFLAVDCENRPTRIWDTAQDQLLAELPSVTPAGGDFASAYPAVSAAGDRAAIARGSTVEVYELPGGKLLHTVMHRAAVSTVAFASTGRDLVSGAVDGSLLVTRDGGALVAFPMSSDGIDAAGFLLDGRVVAADAQRRLRVYGPGGTVLAELEVAARVKTLRMSPDGQRLVTVPRFLTNAASPELWNLDPYRRVAQLEDPNQGHVFSARFVAGGEILTACADGAARRWDGMTGRLRQTYAGGVGYIADAALSVDGSMVVAGEDGLLRFWETRSGRPLWTMRAHGSHVVGIRLDGDDVVTRGYEGDIARWTLPRPERVIAACRAHEPCAVVFK